MADEVKITEEMDEELSAMGQGNPDEDKEIADSVTKE